MQDSVQVQECHLWEAPARKAGNPDNLYRLRVSVVNDRQLRGDCPTQTFLFDNLALLKQASKTLSDAFEGPPSAYMIKKCGVGYPDVEEKLDDGKMEMVVICYDSSTATETWRDVLVKLKSIEKDWILDPQSGC